ncbi:MAG: flavodoxin-dependent (E)-4-hydroxy-3-methylbut-2-enyl-diphosphate synthase [Dehalococcoidia bacterium]|nr:flavodoxin-dependent (E)-4-hydroxy-3-methylbut-2-enyl-diphosphate synthase [Dehalococcoidia bacterium]
MRTRRSSIPIRLRDTVIGGDAPVSVQSMTRTDTRDVRSTVEQIRNLADAGCDIVRLAVPDMEAAEALAAICPESPVPIVADIHFDHRLALAAIDSEVDGLRLNPGNITRREHLERVVSRARERSVPIRIGVNGGSLPEDYRPDEPLPERMVALAMEQVQLLEELDFRLIKVSLKVSDARATIDAYRLIADRIPYPLHLGVTEAGPPLTGAIRNALGIGILLNEGIGDTIRVSMSGDPLLEVEAGREILGSLHLASPGPCVVSCPTCGRTALDVPVISARVAEFLRTVKEPIRVAVMGCVVNGPGECRDADVGIAGGDGKVLLYRGGAFVRSVPTEVACDVLFEEIRSVLQQGEFKHVSIRGDGER